MPRHQRVRLRAITPFLAALLITALAVGWGRSDGTVSAATTGRWVRQAGESCPLTIAQQKNSIKAWQKMMPVFRHPRCLNCHGGIPDPFPDSKTGNSGEGRKAYSPRHVGVVDIDSMAPANICENCHMTGWTMPSSGFYFVNKSDVQICVAMKSRFNGARFVDHIRREEGGIQFIAAAFRGKRGLDADPGAQAIYEAETGKTFKAEPPPITHAQFVQQAQAWVTSQGGDLVGDDECGCVPPETGEVYLLEIHQIDNRGFPGIVVTDEVTMKIRIEDTTVTAFAITNFPSKAAPEMLTFPQGVPSTISWIPDPVGLMNIVSATGSLALDFPVDGTRELKVDFTHSGTRDPQFLHIWPPLGSRKEVRQTFGGGAIPGNPGSVQFDLVPGKTVYDNGQNGLLEVKLTLLFSPKPAK